MKKFNKRFLFNVIVTGLCIGSVVFFGLKQDLLYDDVSSSNTSFTLTNKGDLTVDSIEGVYTQDGFIRVQNNEPYELVLGFDGNMMPYQEFTFESDLKDVTFDLKFDLENENFYMSRTFVYLKGFDTISLFAIAILLVQLTFYIPFVLNLRDVAEKDESIYQMSLMERMMRTPSVFFGLLLGAIGLVFLINIIINPEFFIYQMSDSLILGLGVFIILGILGWSLYLVMVVQNYRLEFKHDSLAVSQKGKVLFSSSYDDLIVEERVIQTSGISNNYTNMVLILKSKQPGVSGVELNLLYLGYKEYNKLVARLHSLATVVKDEDIIQDAGSINGIFYAKKNGVGVTIRSIILSLLFSFILFVALIALEESVSATTMIASTLVLIVLFVFLIFKFVVQKTKKISIKSDMGGISVNDVFYEASSIKKIMMTRPAEGVTTSCRFVLKHASGTLIYQIRLEYKKQFYFEQYRHLYLNINKNYPDILNQ